MENSPQSISPAKLTATCLFVLTVMLTAAALSYTRAMMIPFAISIFFSLMLKPAVLFLQNKLRLPRVIIVLLVLSISIVFLVIFTQAVKNTVLDILTGIDVYSIRLQRAIDTVLSTDIAAGLDIDKTRVLSVLRNLPFLDYVQNLTGQAVSIVSNTILVLVFVFFILSGQNKSYAYNTTLATAIDLQIRRYILTKFVSSAVTGFAVGLTLWILDVDLAVMFGFFTFLLNFIPTIGSIVSVILPIPVILLQFDSLLPTVLAIVIPTGIQFFIGTFIEPKILGRNLDMHPVTILMSLMFWGIIWGPVGMFLAVPIMAAVKLILEKFKATKSVSDLMSGRISF
ncbi:AI-2E family transporter [Oligoflexaceae bacterium]|nr:AI-2E family transporter [Oligoflexaceae bacterium]